MINLMGTTIIVLDMVLKMKNRWKKYLETRLLWLCTFILI